MSINPFLGVNVTAANVEELHHRGLLEEGEILLALFDGVLLDEHRRRVGGLALTDFVALTDQRLITWARGLFSDTVDGFAWADVDVARTESWDPWHGRVQLGFRIPAPPPRERRIAIQVADEQPAGERIIINTLDYMPGEDVPALNAMVAWVGDQALSGLAGAELAAAFAAQFPAPERPAPQAFFTTAPAPPPPAEPAAPAPPRRWWQRSPAPAVSAAEQSNLIAAYESRRGGPVASSGPAMPQAGPVPSLPEQPNMYEVSRSLRLAMEAPRRLAHSLRRATEIVSGAGELMSGMQDPRVRRNAMRGLYQAAAQQEVDGGRFAPVAPLVRAVVRFSEPLEEEAPTPQRRIQVRSRSRVVPSEVEVAAAEPARPGPAAREPDQGGRAPIKRSISVRRVEPPAEAEDAPRPAVRRIVVSRDNED